MQPGPAPDARYAGEEEGGFANPSDIAVEPGATDRDTRVAVVDRDGDRVQVLTLEGRCYGTFPGLSGQPGVG